MYPVLVVAMLQNVLNWAFNRLHLLSDGSYWSTFASGFSEEHCKYDLEQHVVIVPDPKIDPYRALDEGSDEKSVGQNVSRLKVLLVKIEATIKGAREIEISLRQNVGLFPRMLNYESVIEKKVFKRTPDYINYESYFCDRFAIIREHCQLHYQSKRVFSPSAILYEADSWLFGLWDQITKRRMLNYKQKA